MRKSTLMLVSYIIVFPVVYLLPHLAETAGFGSLPRWSMATSGIAALVCAGVLSFVLTPINKSILEWRKARGRDIEEEERYETDQGMIRLTPNDNNEKR
ncbi:MAG: hypothetical protein ACKVRN_12250 [Pyrinomonadaceae bacterium]